MPITIHRPTVHTESYDIPPGEPTIFLAGPIMGAPDWHTESIDIIGSVAPDGASLHIACPSWPLVPEADRLDPDAQRAWEKLHYRQTVLRARAGKGAVAFWIAGESQEGPKPNREGRAYGQGTRSEFSEVIGMWEGISIVRPFPVPIVLGIDPKHSGRGLGEYRHTADEFNIPIQNSLGTLCMEAIRNVGLAPRRVGYPAERVY